MECSYCQKLKSYGYGDFIAETEYWVIFLAPNQSNLGTCVIALKRHYGKLSGLKPEEWSDFSKIVDRLEYALKKAFDVTMFNWGCLLNSFYLEDQPNPHLHWHFIPRYTHKVHFEGIVFEDPYFGYMRPRPVKNVSTKLRKKIIAKIKENLK
ncbi:MAG: HIT family protein [Euryarchaeota archaeon]|nr:HIT family protein [Euryarchaeota archaeon]